MSDVRPQRCRIDPSWVNRLGGIILLLAVLLFFGAPRQLLDPIGPLGLVIVFRPRFVPL